MAYVVERVPSGYRASHATATNKPADVIGRRNWPEVLTGEGQTDYITMAKEVG